LQLAHPLHLHGQVATDLHDLALNGIRQYGGSAPPLSLPRGTNDLGLRHSIPQAYPDSLGCPRMYRLERFVAKPLQFARGGANLTADVACIRAVGYQERFIGRIWTYYDVCSDAGAHQYWTMGNPVP